MGMSSVRVLVSVLVVLACAWCAAGQQTSTVNFCYTSSSFPNSPYGPWTIVVQGTLTLNSTSYIPSLNLAPVSAGGGRPGNNILAASATRTQTNRDGSVSTAQLNLCTAGVQGSDQIVYKTVPFTDWNGFCLNVTSASDLADGQPGWLVFPNGFPSRSIEIYYDLPSQSYPNIYHGDEPFNPNLTVSASPLTCTAPSTAPQTSSPQSVYGFCYQAYGTTTGSALPWSASIGGVLKTLSTQGLTASSALGFTSSTYGQYVLSATGTRLQQIGTNASTSNPIVGLSWIHPGGLDGNDGLPDPFLLASKPHLTGLCPNVSSPTCFGGLVLYAANPFFFPNNVETIDSSYALVNAIDLRNVNGAIIESNSATPTFSQFAVAPSSGSAPACPLISSAAAASTIDASPLFPGATVTSAFNVSFGYWLNSLGINLTSSVPYSGNGFWSVAVSGILTVQSVTGLYTGAANASLYSQAYQVIAATGERIYTDAIGRTTVSQITGVVPRQTVYTAGSAVSVPLNNSNLMYVTPTTSSGEGFGSFTVDLQGLAFFITPPPSAVLANPGLPGFPSTARFNSFSYLKLASYSGPTSSALYETAYGPILIDGAIAAPDSYSAETGLAYTAYTTSLGIQLFPIFNPLPVSLVPAASAYTTAGLCYIIYPDETAQNGKWSIATSALVYLSPQVITIPFGFTNGSGYALRQAQIMYALTGLTRTYINEYGQVFTSSGAVLQGMGGDGGSDNLVYTSVLAGDREGLLVDGDGFTYTLLGAGATTPGDPTLAYGINFYSEFNYREAAEPFHQDGEYGGPGTSFTLTPGATKPPTCVAASFSTVVQKTQVNVQYTFCYAITGTSDWSVVANGTYIAAPTAFSSFNSAGTVLYYIGVNMTGQRSYLSSPSAAPQVSQIIGIPSPGGDGQYDQKYYINSTYKLDGGGWGYYVSPAAQVFGLTGTSSTVRIFNSGSNATGPWLEGGLPQLATVPIYDVSASNFYVQPYLGATYSTCTPTTATIAATATGSLCFMTYSLAGNIDYPWSVATSLQFVYNLTAVTNQYGTAVRVISGSGTRTFTNRFGQSFTTAVTVAPPGTNFSDNLLYVNSPTPLDGDGLTLNLASYVQLPGHGPSVLYNYVNLYNASGGVLESHSSRIDTLGQAFLTSVPFFVNRTIGASNINTLAPNYATCSAPITFTNGERQPTQPTQYNGAVQFGYYYFISDGSTYSVTANLTIFTNNKFATLKDQLGNPYQQVINITGTRTYKYIPSGATVVSTVNGLSLTAYANADQRWYPYALVSSSPGVYSTNTAPYVGQRDLSRQQLHSLQPSALAHLRLSSAVAVCFRLRRHRVQHLSFGS